jgi:hypothetical protein
MLYNSQEGISSKDPLLMYSIISSRSHLNYGQKAICMQKKRIEHQ